MIFYHYPHCPFCQRVRLLLALKKIPHESRVLSYSDSQTPMSLIGKQMLPILQHDDGTAMGESLDILHYLEDVFSENPITEGDITWASQAVMRIPRYMDLVLPYFLEGSHEWDTEGAKFFRESKEKKRGMTFDELKASRHEIFRENIQEPLQEIVHRLSGHSFIHGKEITMADCVLAADISGITLVEDIPVSKCIIDYVARVEDRCGETLYK